MNSKTTIEYTSSSCNGGIMGGGSPAALLDMLAEVASRTLHSEKKQIKSLLATRCKPKAAELAKRKAQGASFTVPQLLSMPTSQLVKQFSIFTSDELKRQYSYACALTNDCGQKYTSFASESKARISIKAHLVEHLEQLKGDKHAYDTFTTTSAKYGSPKTILQHKKNKMQQSKKPRELPNKENKSLQREESMNYLRKLLSDDTSFRDMEKQKSVETTNGPNGSFIAGVIETDRTDVRVLGDHSYYERVKDEASNDNENSSIDNILDKAATRENIVLMVVGTDSVHTKEYARVHEKSTEDVKYQQSDTVYLSEIPWSKESDAQNVEIVTSAKPKGKAKFIGTSKAEREMALAFIERIKMKGNPTGSNLQCRICDPPRSFTAPTTLVSHYRSHAGIKPYECRICRAVFTRRHSLKYHMLIHQNQTRFTCADCGKKFRHPSHFREHRRRHTGEAPFGCDDCGQRFKTRNTYKRHLKTRHGKVLTTSGDLLYLPPEDFQKVRTNRKKKIDYTVSAGSKIDTGGEKICQEYHRTDERNVVVCNDARSRATNVTAAAAAGTTEGDFGNDDIFTESRTGETERADTKMSVPYDGLGTADRDRDDTFRRGNVQDPKRIGYQRDANKTIHYSDSISDNHGDNGDDCPNDVRLLESEVYEDADDLHCDHQSSQPYGPVYKEATDENGIAYGDNVKGRYGAQIIVSQGDVVYAHSSEYTDDTDETARLQVAGVNCPVGTVTAKKGPHLYVHAVQSSIGPPIVLDKRVAPLSRKLNAKYDKNRGKPQLANCTKLRLFNDRAQAINFIRNGSQGAILLLSSDTLNNGVSNVDQHDENYISTGVETNSK